MISSPNKKLDPIYIYIYIYIYKGLLFAPESRLTYWVRAHIQGLTNYYKSSEDWKVIEFHWFSLSLRLKLTAANFVIPHILSNQF